MQTFVKIKIIHICNYKGIGRKYMYIYKHTCIRRYIYTYIRVYIWQDMYLGRKEAAALVLYLLLLFLIGRQYVTMRCAFSAGLAMARDGNVLGKPWSTT